MTRKKSLKKIKPVYHPSVLPSPTRSPALPPTKEKYVQHLWQIGTAVITFKYYHTQKQHTSLRKKPPIIQVGSTRKKEYKTYTLLRSFLSLSLLGTDRLPLSKAIQLCGCIYFFVGFLYIFLTSVYAGITNFGGYSRYAFLCCWASP